MERKVLELNIGKNSTTFGSTGTLSFYPAKILGCFGDGGAIITNNKKIANKLFKLRDHGRGISEKSKLGALTPA